MALSDVDVERFARQIIIPGVGAEGQARLLASTVFVAGCPRGAARARLYLNASGVRVASNAAGAKIDCVLVAGTDAVGPRIDELLALGCPLVWYRIRASGLAAGIHYCGAHGFNVAPGPMDASGTGTPSHLDDLLHDVAACDAVASVLSVLLDWRPPQLRYEARLA